MSRPSRAYLWALIEEAKAATRQANERADEAVKDLEAAMVENDKLTSYKEGMEEATAGMLKAQRDKIRDLESRLDECRRTLKTIGKPWVPWSHDRELGPS
jgi:seryl-tRNA synthetase